MRSASSGDAEFVQCVFDAFVEGGVGIDHRPQCSDGDPPSLVNKFAAVPSLHVGWNLLVGVFIFTRSRNRLARLFALASPAFMATAVVLTANHYIIDAVAGSVVAIAGLAAAFGLCRATSTRISDASPVIHDDTRDADDRKPGHRSWSGPGGASGVGRPASSWLQHVPHDSDRPREQRAAPRSPGQHKLPLNRSFGESG